MILLIQIQNLPFHYYEFVKPIEDILDSIPVEYESIHYKKITSNHITKTEKIIISGTSLKDNIFLDDIISKHDHYLLPFGKIFSQ